MKQFIVDRHTTPNTPTLKQVPTEKIPVYDDIDAAAADLANLAENQIIATHDTGSELSAPVDVVQSGNMHAVSSNAVAESLSYSTEEMATGGKWIDGKPIYRTVVDFGTLPNNTTRFVAHNISNIDTMIKYSALADDGTYFVQIPRVGIQATDPIDIFCSREHIYITTRSDLTQYVKTYVTLEYTKTTDQGA